MEFWKRCKVLKIRSTIRQFLSTAFQSVLLKSGAKLARKLEPERLNLEPRAKSPRSCGM